MELEYAKMRVARAPRAFPLNFTEFFECLPAIFNCYRRIEFILSVKIVDRLVYSLDRSWVYFMYKKKLYEGGYIVWSVYSENNSENCGSTRVDILFYVKRRIYRLKYILIYCIIAYILSYCKGSNLFWKSTRYIELGLDLCVKRSYTKEKCRYAIILFYCKGLIVVFNFRYRYFKCKW